MDHAAPGPLLEPELRARVAAGSQDPDDHIALADLLQSDGRDDEAVRVYERLLGIRLTGIQRATVLNELGNLLAGRGQRDRARTLAQEALDLVAQEQEGFEALMVRGLSLFRIADVTWGEDPHEAETIAQRALQVLEQAVRAGGDPEAMGVAHFAAAWLYCELGDQETAIAYCRRCLEGPLRSRDRPEVLNLLAEACRLSGRLDEAEGAAQSALRLTSLGPAESSAILMTLGTIQQAAGRLTEARATINRALETLMQHRFLQYDRELLRAIHSRLGEIEYDAREYARAADSFRWTLAHCPKDGLDRHRALIWLGDCYLAMGAKADARPCYEEVVRSPVAAPEERRHAQDGLTKLGMQDNLA